MEDAPEKTPEAAKKGAAALMAGAADVATQAEQVVVHAVITAAKGVEHAMGAVVALGWTEFHDLVEAGKARPASRAEVDKAFPPAPVTAAEPGPQV